METAICQGIYNSTATPHLHIRDTPCFLNLFRYCMAISKVVCASNSVWTLQLLTDFVYGHVTLAAHIKSGG